MVWGGCGAFEAAAAAAPLPLPHSPSLQPPPLHTIPCPHHHPPHPPPAPLLLKKKALPCSCSRWPSSAASPGPPVQAQMKGRRNRWTWPCVKRRLPCTHCTLRLARPPWTNNPYTPSAMCFPPAALHTLGRRALVHAPTCPTCAGRQAHPANLHPFAPPTLAEGEPSAPSVDFFLLHCVARASIERCLCRQAGPSSRPAPFLRHPPWPRANPLRPARSASRA